ncbi:Uncharacterized protein LARI1_G000916 [Lachnellula arida]|uniref:Uncharacterized protein n=1 Tax=Lachnellula arida TaxID=1316785 RepID=A0A8T9BR65_9HELO|nr:Uncharacterized protein LARI1_G000916 [Lachnellula arida]
MNSPRPPNRPPNNRSRGRGAGAGYRSRGGFNDRHTSTPSPAVPTTHQVIPGAPVSLVLKADQGTGTEVQGIVAELLTRGEHPRGIKVRLRDGRVGRVQRMGSRETGEAGEGMSGLGRNGELGNGSHAHAGIRVAGPRYGDYRVEAPDSPDAANLSLADYVVVKGSSKKGKGKAKKAPVHEAEEEARAAVQNTHTEAMASASAATSTCPVCGDFEGDEAAVAHHENPQRKEKKGIMSSNTKPPSSSLKTKPANANASSPSSKTLSSTSSQLLSTKPPTATESWPSFFLHDISQFLLYIFISENLDWEFLLFITVGALVLDVLAIVNARPWRGHKRNWTYVVEVWSSIAAGAVVAYVPYWVSWGLFAFLLGGESAARMGIVKDSKVEKGFLPNFGLDQWGSAQDGRGGLQGKTEKD